MGASSAGHLVADSTKTRSCAPSAQRGKTRHPQKRNKFGKTNCSQKTTQETGERKTKGETSKVRPKKEVAECTSVMYVVACISQKKILSAKWCCAKGGSFHGITEDSISSISVSDCAKAEKCLGWCVGAGLRVTAGLVATKCLHEEGERGGGIGFCLRRLEGARHASWVSRDDGPSLVDFICRATEWASRR